MSSRSYVPLFRQLKDLIARSVNVCDSDAGTKATQINEWVTEAHGCLVLLEDKMPTALADFRRIRAKLEFRVDEDAEHLASRSAYRPEWIDELTGRTEGADVLLDFDFGRLEQLARILKLAAKKLELEGYSISEDRLLPGEPTNASVGAVKPSSPDNPPGGGVDSRPQRKRGRPTNVPDELNEKAPGGGGWLGPNKEATIAARAASRQAVVFPILQRKRWKRGRLATEAGLGKNSVYQYLDGTRSKITAQNRKAMAEALDLSEEQLPA